MSSNSALVTVTTPLPSGAPEPTIVKLTGYDGTAHVGIHSVEVHKFPIPLAGKGQLQIKVKAVAVNPVDPMYALNPIGPPGKIVGSDFSGVVSGVGEDVTKWKVGDRIAGLVQGASTKNDLPGAFADYVLSPANLVFRIPDSMSFEEACVVPLCALTAAQALALRLSLSLPFYSPPTASTATCILINGGASVVGQYAIQLLTKEINPNGEKKYHIIATSSPANFELVKKLGADEVVDYHLSEWGEEVKKLSKGGKGVEAALDCICQGQSVEQCKKAFISSDSASSPLIIAGTLPPTNNLFSLSPTHRPDIQYSFGAVWAGLGFSAPEFGIHPSVPFTETFYKYLEGELKEGEFKPVKGRRMPGGLERIPMDAFPLLGYGEIREGEKREEMRKISAEKLVYVLEE